eukprot:TRINITY_DN616_c0_g1_i2.p3 TRINITY_DN616_c0_g1~~TRINITY_DN616_c0_g1_i2.p3  ORF type:complete len:64 (+),score=1.26 TRINITY_DN616_c0_g1_i2:56-247(+)
MGGPKSTKKVRVGAIRYRNTNELASYGRTDMEYELRLDDYPADEVEPGMFLAQPGTYFGLLLN